MPSRVHMSPPLPLIGAGELVGTAAKALRECDAVMVVEDGKPIGVLTRHDLLGFLSDGTARDASRCIWQMTLTAHNSGRAGLVVLSCSRHMS